MFNSRSRKYRDPVGAVAEGTPIHFRITLPRELSCSAAHLVIQREGSDTQVLDLFWCGMNGNNQEWWECHFTPGAPGLYFYHFEVRTHRGSQRLSKGFAGDGIFGGNNQWQLTVYDKAFQTPDWLEGGIMYQIFPDRFYKSGAAKGEIPTGRTFHENWQDQPDWAPNAQGKITNTDFFGGDLQGIREKLPYLKELGVTCLYMNPIFESHSNHRYDTADYSKIDPLLGDEEDFRALCQAAKELGIRVVIDGVFSHTGSDSVYFNREGRYPHPRGLQLPAVPLLPLVLPSGSGPIPTTAGGTSTPCPTSRRPTPATTPTSMGKRGIVRKWLAAGASGWRLDVADELPDPFLDNLTAAAKAQRPDALVLGEVWEDASNKTAYGVRRRYLLGQQLDTVMNYPFRDAILGFLLGGRPAELRRDGGEHLRELPAPMPAAADEPHRHPRHRAGLDHPGRGACRQPGPGVAGGSTPVTGAVGDGTEAAASGIPDPVPASRSALSLLRGRGRHGRLPGPLQPGLLSLGQRGSKPAHLVQGPGAAPRPGERHFRAGLVPHPVRQREPAGL